jgi:hypothetical protein
MQHRVQCAVILFVVLALTAAHAQVFRVQGGDSTLLNAQGGSVEFKAPQYDGTLGLGFYNGQLRYGASTRYLYRGYTILGGDEAIPFTLPTDVFDASHYFSARGLGITRGDETNRFYALAGTTSTWVGTGFFSAATSDRLAGLFFYEHKWSREWKFFSRNIASNSQTSLQGVEWTPEKWMKAAVSGGIGSNQNYFASSVDIETQKLAFKSSYVVAGDQFQRVTVASPLSSEVNKGNVQMLYRPSQFVSITTGHENILEPVTFGAPMQQATVNQLSTDFHVRRFYLGTGLFSSDASGRRTEGKNIYVGRRIGQRFEVNTNWFESKPKSPVPGTVGSGTVTILSATVREDFSSRFSLLQLISRTNGQTTFAFGGDFTSNRIQFRADYQNVYLPFRPLNPFEQALALNVMLRVTGPLQLTAASNVAPDGRIRYSFGASTWLYRQRGMAVDAVSQDSFSISKYVVQGLVKDEQALPVEGAALHIGKEIAYTDSSGHFEVRFSKHGPYALAVAPDEFLSNTIYEVVTAPAQVRADADDIASQIDIVVRHKAPTR